MAGCFFLLGSWASGTVLAPASPLGFHWFAPPGLLVSSHSNLNRWSKYSFDHCVGLVVQVTSRPLVMASPAMPVLYALVQPRPRFSIGAPSGSCARWVPGPAPWVLPKGWPPAISATVSSSFFALRPKVIRVS